MILEHPPNRRRLDETRRRRDFRCPKSAGVRKDRPCVSPAIFLKSTPLNTKTSYCCTAQILGGRREEWREECRPTGGVIFRVRASCRSSLVGANFAERLDRFERYPSMNYELRSAREAKTERKAMAYGRCWLTPCLPSYLHISHELALAGERWMRTLDYRDYTASWHQIGDSWKELERADRIASCRDPCQL